MRFCVGVSRGAGCLTFFLYGDPIVPVSFINSSSLFWWHRLGSSVENKWIKCMCLSGLPSVPLAVCPASLGAQCFNRRLLMVCGLPSTCPNFFNQDQSSLVAARDKESKQAESCRWARGLIHEALSRRGPASRAGVSLH